MPGKKSPRSGDSATERSWELQEIQQLIDMLIEREIAEFEMEKDGMRIRIMRRESGGSSTVQTVRANSDAAPSSRGEERAAPTPQPQPQEPLAHEAEAETTIEGLHILKSPIVGTFYASPTPEAPAFVSVGDVVYVGQVLCIVEAMKLMNEIESEVAGEIVRIHAENGQPVEYGQPLFTIKPS